MKRKTILFFFSGGMVFVFLVTVAIAPLNTRKDYQNLVKADTIFVENFESAFYHPELRDLITDRSYKEALLKLSESDSIQLVVNLMDSMINLSIKGVVLHQAKITAFKKDRLLSNIPLMQEVHLFSKPLEVESCFATIVKEPVVIRHAPKDASEAALNAWSPDTLIQNPAFAVFTLEQHIRLIMEQSTNRNRYDNRKRLAFYSHIRIHKVMASISNFTRLKKQEYKATITVNIPVEDLRAIYRALPDNIQVVVKL